MLIELEYKVEKKKKSKPEETRETWQISHHQFHLEIEKRVKCRAARVK